MGRYEGLKCPVCSQELQDGEDIVVCPQCGAPHHRACWNELGRCAHADDHGTERQWTRPKPKEDSAEKEEPRQEGTGSFCPRCGHPNEPGTLFCIKCGMPLQKGAGAPNSRQGQQPYQTYNPWPGAPMGPVIDPMGGVAPDETIEDVTAADMAAFIGPKAPYYIPRFFAMAKNKTAVSINWAAGLIPDYWSAYRKIGGLFLVAAIIMTLVNIPTYVAYFQRIAPSLADPQAFLAGGTAIASAGAGSYTPPDYLVTLSRITSWVALAFRVCMLLFSNRMYMSHVIRSIKKQQKINPTGYKAILMQKGKPQIAFPILYQAAIYVVLGIILAVMMGLNI